MCTALLAHSCAGMYKYILVCNYLAPWKLMLYIYESFCRTHYICVSIVVHLCTTIPLHPCVLLCESMCNTESMYTPLLEFLHVLLLTCTNTSVCTAVHGHPCVPIYQEILRHINNRMSLCTALLLHKYICVHVQCSNSIFTHCTSFLVNICIVLSQ